MQQPLTVDEAKAFYDHFGHKQDSQSFYEDAALDDLVAHSAFESADHVFEFGCGTGRLAERLFRNRLSRHATYQGVDVSTTMVGIAKERLQPFGERAEVRRITGRNPFEGIGRAPDRIVTTYVLDLLAEDEIASFVDCSARMLAANGRLCVASLTFGRTPLSRVVSAGWRAVFRLSPRAVGGCRPIRLLPFFSPDAWDLVHHGVISSLGIASEVIVAIPYQRSM